MNTRYFLNFKDDLDIEHSVQTQPYASTTL